MATYQFSALADGQAISFSPNTDLLNFDQTAIAAADIRVSVSGSNVVVTYLATGKDVTLLNVTPLQLATSNVTFANGSLLLFGDNTAGTAADNSANSLTGSTGDDLLQGFGGADTMNGGAGNDTYIVGTGDVLSDSGGIDTVVTDITWSLGTAFENLTMTGTANITMQGNNLNNLIIGNSGNNTFNARAGNDTILAGAGNDRIDMFGNGFASYGNEVVDGGAGFDNMDFSGYAKSAIVVDLGAGTVVGGGDGGLGTVAVSNVEMVITGAFDDHITGSANAESFDGRGGNDTISGGAGNDTLSGGAGPNDFVFSTAPGSANADLITDFSSGSDKIHLDNTAHANLGAAGNFTAGDARFFSGPGATSGQDASDRVIYNTTTGQLFYDSDGSGSEAAQLIATLQSGATLVATDIAVEGSSGGGQTINGTSGNDDLFGDSGNDTLNGFAGNDYLNGAGGDDLLDGGDGADMLEGQAGNDTAFGGAGDDYFFFETRQDTALGQDVLDGGSGLDTLYFFGNFPGGVIVNAAAGTFSGPRPGDGGTLTGIENFMGTRFADSITGDASANRIDGMGGSDTLAGGAGDDTLQGGFFDSSSGELLIGGDGNDSIMGGGNGNDTLQGGIGDDYLQGGWGSDAIAGDGGNDLIRGNSGNDTLTGGAGADGFLFGANPHPANAVLLTDFASGVDKLRLEASAMPDLGVGGNFATGDVRFYAAAGATGGHDSDDRIIYNTSTGALFYDADGNGSGAAQPIATLQGAAALSATDIQVDGGDGPGQVFTGTAGHDSLVGTDGDDTLNGLGGNDTLDGKGGNDSLNGGVGNDSLLGGRGFDHFIGGEGNDTLNGSYGEFFGDREIETDTLDGGSGDDLYIVDNAGDTLLDSGGIDTVRVMDMDWTLGAGFENLVVQNDISESGFTGIGNELDNVIRTTYTGGRLEGLGGNDTLSGGSVGSVRLLGGEGNDSLIGAGDGGSRLDGGAGNDTMGDLHWGTFVFSVAPGAANADRIVGFGSGQDIELDGNVHASSGVTGRFAAGDARFAAGAGFTSGQDATDRVVYNTATGQLFYDADGSGSGAAQLIATLEGAPTLSATSIVIINGSTANVFTGTAGNDSLVGTSVEDTIFGLGGDDTLDGLGGNDSLDGGTGNDTYYAALGDVLSDAGGIDLVIANGWTLGPGFENLTLPGSSDDGRGTGNELANVLDGRAARTAGLFGGGGNDTLYGTDGAVFGAGMDTLAGGDGDDEIHGGGNADSVHGDAGNDLLFGDDGNDGILGGLGNDTMFGGAGDDHFFLTGAGDAEYGQDTVDGGAGFDTLQFRSLDSSAIVVDFGGGTAVGGGPGGAGRVTFTGIERVSGTQFADRMTGDAAANTLNGNEGNDTLAGGAGNDNLLGGAGSDSFLFAVAPSAANADFISDFSTGADKIQLDRAAHANLGTAGNFAAGDARFFAGTGANSGQDASDRVIYNTNTGQLWYDADGNGAGGAQLIATLSGAPTLVATDIAVVGGAAGPMTINGTAGDDSLGGGDGNDTINGLDGNDTLTGNGGNDSLNGGAGTDSVNGGLGNDTYVVTTGDVLADTGGTDTVVTDVTWSLGLEFENLTMTGTGSITMQGNNLNNLIIGNAGNNTFNARAGDDTIQAGAGNDRIDMFGNGFASYGNEVVDGGAGIDSMDFSGYAKSGIVVDLAAGTVVGGGDAGSGTVAVSNVERVITGAFNDDFTGNSGANAFDGRGGNDTLSGGSGNDTLTGGTGNDFFVFETAPSSTNVERITDFVSATDKLQLENDVFTAIGATGTFAAGDGRFWAAAGATTGHDANDRVVYNTSTGSLYYDADGSASGAAILLATFQGNPAIAATDITVI